MCNLDVSSSIEMLRNSLTKKGDSKYERDGVNANQHYLKREQLKLQLAVVQVPNCICELSDEPQKDL